MTIFVFVNGCLTLERILYSNGFGYIWESQHVDYQSLFIANSVARINTLNPGLRNVQILVNCVIISILNIILMQVNIFLL